MTCASPGQLGVVHLTGVRVVPPEKLAEMRAKVLANFPDSGYGPVPVLGPFARNLASGKVISLADRPNRDRRR